MLVGEREKMEFTHMAKTGRKEAISSLCMYYLRCNGGQLVHQPICVSLILVFLRLLLVLEGKGLQRPLILPPGARAKSKDNKRRR